MIDFGVVLESLFMGILRVSLQTSLLVILVVVVQGLLRNQISPSWRHALWGLVLMRLLLIWTVSTPFSVHNLYLNAIRRFPAEDLSTTEPVPAQIVNLGLPVSNITGSDSTDAEVNSQAEHIQPAVMLMQPTWTERLGSFVSVAAGLWLVGLLLTLWIMITLAHRLTARVARRRLVTEPSVLELFEQCKQEMGVSTWLPLMVSPLVSGPTLLGFVRPRLLLPPWLLDHASRSDLRNILLHELAHVKRSDILTGWLFDIVLALHWFNPILWWARRRMTADRELACDARVLSILNPEERPGYGHALLDQFQRAAKPAWCPGLAGILEGKTRMERRIAMITQFKRPSTRRVALALTVMLVLAVVALTDAQVPDDEDEDETHGGTIESVVVDQYGTPTDAQVPDDEDEDETHGGAIEGVVVDQYGTPIENASLFLQKRPEQENAYVNPPVAHTAPDGTFRVDGVRLDLNALYADHPDFSPGWTSMAPDVDSIDTVRITLVPGGTVEGTVTVDGQPSQGHIAALRYGVIGSVASEPDGSYRLERLTPGIVAVKAFVTRHRGMTRTASVEPGKTAVLDFDFPAAEAILEGHVTMDGAPVPKALLRLSVNTAADASAGYTTSPDGDGFFRFENLPAGEASMAAYSTDKSGPSRRRSVSFEIASEGVTVQDVDLTVGNCAVSGRIDIPRRDCNGAVCILDGEVVLEEFTLSVLESLDSRMAAYTNQMNGTYRFDGLAPGTYTLLVVIYPDDVDSTSDLMGQALVVTEVVSLEESQEEVVDLWPLPAQ